MNERDTIIQAQPQPAGFQNALSSARRMLGQPAVKKALPALAAIGVLMLAAGAWWSVQEPPLRPLFSELADGDKAAVIDALQAANIAHQVDRDTGSVTVAEDDVHRARILLAGQGLPKAAPSSASIAAALPMGSSRALESEALRGGREADLARTIEAIDAVKSARVHLATPEPSVFVREQSAPAASVMLTLRNGRSLSELQIGAIKHLVAAAVPSMTPDQVTIIDQAGNLLSQTGEGVSAPFDLQVRLEERYRQSLMALLTPVVGAGNVQTEVRVEVDRSESQSTRETYPKDDRALVSEQSTRSGGGYSVGGFGIPGALSNQPPANPQLGGPPVAPPPAATPSSEENVSRNFNVGREISVTHQPTGQIRRLSVAVIIRDGKGNKARRPPEMAALDSLVKGAIGFDAARGDTVAISARPFIEVTDEPVSFWEEDWFLPAMRQAGAILVAVLVVLLIGIPLVRALRRRAAMPATVSLEGPSGTGIEVAPITAGMIEAAPTYAARADLIRDYVRQNPQHAALVARNLVQESNNG